ncbi:MAG: SDR family oxidoreductase [Alphaproteobacteria bacterium]|nr:SDR family oxidoreductase [Alphaproteobacteria bacterium]
MAETVSDRVVIVTGGTGNLGAAICRRAAAQGWRVAFVYRSNKAKADALAAEIGGLAIAADITDDAECHRAVDATLARWGRIDALVNNAATTKFVAHPDLDGLTGDDFARIFAMNVTAPFQMVRAAAPALRDSGAGSVVNVSSVAATQATGSSIAYGASKAALDVMSRALARVLGPEIRVNVVSPGFIEGEWLRQGWGDARYEEVRAKTAERTPLKRAGSPDDQAEVIVWLLAGGRHVTGEIITVDGGSRLGAGPPAKLRPRGTKA